LQFHLFYAFPPEILGKRPIFTFFNFKSGKHAEPNNFKLLRNINTFPFPITSCKKKVSLGFVIKRVKLKFLFPFPAFPLNHHDYKNWVEAAIASSCGQQSEEPFTNEYFPITTAYPFQIVRQVVRMYNCANLPRIYNQINLSVESTFASVLPFTRAALFSFCLKFPCK